MPVTPETHLQQNIMELPSALFARHDETVHIDHASNFTELYGALLEEGSDAGKQAANVLLRLITAVDRVMPHGRQWVPDTFELSTGELPRTIEKRGLIIVGVGIGSIVLEKEFALGKTTTRKVNLPPRMLGFALNTQVSPQTIIRSGGQKKPQTIALFSGRIERF